MNLESAFAVIFRNNHQLMATPVDNFSFFSPIHIGLSSIAAFHYSTSLDISFDAVASSACAHPQVIILENCASPDSVKSGRALRQTPTHSFAFFVVVEIRARLPN